MFHIIAALCLNVFLPYSVFGLCRANFRLPLMFLVGDCIVTMSWISAGSSLSYSVSDKLLFFYTYNQLTSS